MSTQDKMDAAMMALSHSQSILDQMNYQFNTPKPQAPQPQQHEAASGNAPEQHGPPPSEVKGPIVSEPSSLENEAKGIKELNDTIAGGFEAVSKLADAVKQVGTLKKSVTQRLKDSLHGKE